MQDTFGPIGVDNFSSGRNTYIVINFDLSTPISYDNDSSRLVIQLHEQAVDK